MDLSGKVAFITASASGLGKGYAEALLKKGAKVFLNDIDTETGKRTLAEFEGNFGVDNVRFRPLDVRNEAQFEDVFKAALAEFGQIDIMVNNAGVANETAWQVMLQVNMFGVVKGTKLAEEHMRKDKGGKGGRIINISSQTVSIRERFDPLLSTMLLDGIYSIYAQFDIEAKGIEYATICPEAVETKMVNQADGSIFSFYERIKPILDQAMPISQVVRAFMELVQLEHVNGAILLVTKEAWSYQRLELKDLGPTYVSAVQNWYD